MKNALKTMYLRLDTTSKSLTNIALSQLIYKIIYFSDPPVTKNKILVELKAFLQTNIERSKVEDALSLLISEKNVKLDRDTYSIPQEKRKNIDGTLIEYNRRIDSIIANYFNNTQVDKQKVRVWFEKVNIEFFTKYKDEWIFDTVNKRKTQLIGLDNLIEKVNKGIKDISTQDLEWLKRKYLDFIDSSDPDVNFIFWNYGLTAFSSTLITSSLSADSLSVNELKDAVFLLDTNILMYLQLEEDVFHESYTALENIFDKLNITPGFLTITNDEYVNSMEYKKDLILKVIGTFDDEVIAESDDPFIKSAEALNCSSVEDYKNFFDQILPFPTKFVDKIDLIEENNEAILKAVKTGCESSEIQEAINLVYKNRRRYFNSLNKDKVKPIKDKRKGSLVHDSGLVCGAQEFWAQGKKCYILTRDSTLIQYAKEIAVRDQRPIAIGLDTLIGLLAVANGGVDIDPTNFQPLFANLIKLSIIPEKHAFQVEDLAHILEKEQQIADLPADDVMSIATELNRRQFHGEDEGAIALFLSRRLQKTKLRLKEDLQITSGETKIYKEKLKKSDNDRYSTKIENQLLKLKIKIGVNWLLFVILIPFISFLAFLKLGSLPTNITPQWSFIIGLLGSLSSSLICYYANKKPQLWITKKSHQAIREAVLDEIER